jgi:hypothetical protein
MEPTTNWASMPPTQHYELRCTLANETVEAFQLSREEYHDLKLMLGEIRRELWMDMPATLSVAILLRKATVLLVGAAAAMLTLKWEGRLAVGWLGAASPVLVVAGGWLLRSLYTRSRS